MWHSATAAAVALTQYHLLVDAFGGLGGVIVIIVGGIVSAIAIRNARRSAAPPAAHPQPAPPSRREPPVSYGEPAPPTIPSRRLYPGPIPTPPTEEPAPQQPSGPATDDGEPASSLFNPDIFGPATQRGSTSDAATVVHVKPAELPLLGVTDPRDAAWRAPARLTAAPGQPAALPLWSQPLRARPDETASVQAAQASVGAATLPVWGDGAPLAHAAESIQGASAATATPAAQLPVWDMPRGTLDDARETPDEAGADTRANVSPVRAEPPIWRSSPRPPSE